MLKDKQSIQRDTSISLQGSRKDFKQCFISGFKKVKKTKESKSSFIVVQSCFVVNAGPYVGHLESDCFGP